MCSAHSSHGQQDVKLLLLLQPHGFWLSFSKSHVVLSSRQQGSVQGPLSPRPWGCGGPHGAVAEVFPGAHVLLLPLTCGGNRQHLSFGSPREISGEV